MRRPTLLLGAMLLVLSTGCGLKKPRYEVSATEVSNRVLGVAPQQSGEPVAQVREAVRALRQRLVQEKSRRRAPVVAPEPPVTPTSGPSAATPQAIGTSGITRGEISSHAAAATSVQATNGSGVPPAGVARRVRSSPGVSLAVVLGAVGLAAAALLLTRRRTLG